MAKAEEKEEEICCFLYNVQYKSNWICKYQRHGEKGQINEVSVLALLETNWVRFWIKMVVYRKKSFLKCTELTNI